MLTKRIKDILINIFLEVFIIIFVLSGFFHVLHEFPFFLSFLFQWALFTKELNELVNDEMRSYIHTYLKYIHTFYFLHCCFSHVRMRTHFLISSSTLHFFTSLSFSPLFLRFPSLPSPIPNFIVYLPTFVQNNYTLFSWIFPYLFRYFRRPSSLT